MSERKDADTGQGISGWFASVVKITKVPPVWKESMIVLLVLFPLVMLEKKFVAPHMKSLNLSAATFIGNSLTVALLTFPMVPFATRCLGWWLKPKGKDERRTTILGTGLMIVLYVMEILLFW